MKQRHVVLLGLALLVALIGVLGATFFSGAYQFQGSLIDPPIQAADFSLTDQTGGTFRLSDHKGEVVLIFFGYTNCPDVCPVTLAEFKQVKEQLRDKAEQVRFVFITVDPERDTVERIGAHLANFDPGFIGLTGDTADLEAVYKAYGVYAAKAEGGSAAGYLMDHTARVYAIDLNGNLRLTYPFESGSDEIADDVEYLLKETVTVDSNSS